MCPAPSVAGLESGLAIPTLPSGGSVTFTVTATVTATGGSVSNVATVAAPGGVTDPERGNNTATDTDAVGAGRRPRRHEDQRRRRASMPAARRPTPSSVTQRRPERGRWRRRQRPGGGRPEQDRRDLRGRGRRGVPGGATVAQLESGLAIPTLPSGGSVTFTVTATVTRHRRQRQQRGERRRARWRDRSERGQQHRDRHRRRSAPSPTSASRRPTASRGVNAGSTTTYTVVVTNAGPSAADGAVVSDPAAAGPDARPA